MAGHMSLKKASAAGAKILPAGRILPPKPEQPIQSAVPDSVLGVGSLNHPASKRILPHKLAPESHDDLITIQEPTANASLLNSDPFMTNAQQPNAIDDLWSGKSFLSEHVNDDPMVFVNPREVEGIEDTLEVDASIFEDFKPFEVEGLPVVTSDQVPQESAAIPEEKEADVKPILANNSVLQEQAEESSEQSAEDMDGFDLLDYVVNSSIPVNDPNFLAFLDSPVQEDESLKAAQVIPAQVERRPERVCKTRRPKQTTTPLATHADHAYVSQHRRAPRMKYSNSEQRYRRMRNLNNEASRRCRRKRKGGIQELLAEEILLKEQNADLQIRFNILNEQVTALKKLFLHRIGNPSPTAASFDVDAFAAGILE